jgi:hypothetical protein
MFAELHFNKFKTSLSGLSFVKLTFHKGKQRVLLLQCHISIDQ